MCFVVVVDSYELIHLYGPYTFDVAKQMLSKIQSESPYIHSIYIMSPSEYNKEDLIP